MGYLWSGRMRKLPQRAFREFAHSLDVDRALAQYDIRGSIAHARMLIACRIISRSDGLKIVRGLKRIRREVSSGSFRFSPTDEDIHTAIERRLVELCGTAGQKLHTARSRNDQIVLDEKLYLKDVATALSGAIRSLQRAFVGRAEELCGTVMPAYTHLQHSQPVLVSHYFLAYVEMLERDRQRLCDCLARADVLPLGACACCGTSLPIDPRIVARELGFSRIASNSIDAVSDRDYFLEMASVLAILMGHLSRVAEDLILWSTEEFGFLRLPDELSTGSSMMPQKKNPDLLELVRGKAAGAIGAMAGLFALMKGLPLSYNRDMQEDKKPIFEMVETARRSLVLLADFVQKAGFDRKKLEAAAGRGYILATDLAEYLVRKGVPFREAHGICARLVRYCIGKKKELDGLTQEELASFSPAFGKDVRCLLHPKVSVAGKTSAGGTAPIRVRRELEKWKKVLA